MLRVIMYLANLKNKKAELSFILKMGMNLLKILITSLYSINLQKRQNLRIESDLDAQMKYIEKR